MLQTCREVTNMLTSLQNVKGRHRHRLLTVKGRKSDDDKEEEDEKIGTIN